jgi:hypothetical protein
METDGLSRKRALVGERGGDRQGVVRRTQYDITVT